MYDTYVQAFRRRTADPPFLHPIKKKLARRGRLGSDNALRDEPDVGYMMVEADHAFGMVKQIRVRPQALPVAYV